MILVDTSVWVDFVRGAPTRASAFVRDRMGSDLAATEPVLMELLVGARPGRQSAQLERLMLSQAWCGVEPDLDFRGAADVYRAARASGHPPRNVVDCLVAAVALRRGVPVAHRDRDFDWIAAATGLEVVDLT